VGGGLFLRRAVRRNPAWTAGFSGPSPELFRATRGGRAQRPEHVPPMPASRRSACETSPRPPRRGRRLDWERGGSLLVFGTDGPSRPRRCPRPAGWRGAWFDANSGSRCQRSFSRRTKAAAVASVCLIGRVSPPKAETATHGFTVGKRTSGASRVGLRLPTRSRHATGRIERPILDVRALGQRRSVPDPSAIFPAPNSVREKGRLSRQD